MSKIKENFRKDLTDYDSMMVTETGNSLENPITNPADISEMAEKTERIGKNMKTKASGTLLFLDYDGKSTSSSESSIRHDLTLFPDNYREKLDGLGRRLHNIETLLWDNRDKYTSSLDIVANREIEISKALEETKKLLRENRELYTQAFNRLFIKEELLETMIKETKQILCENRKIYLDGMSELHKKNNESFEKIKETGILLGGKNGKKGTTM